MREVKRFFEDYKALENKTVVVGGFLDRPKALESITQAIERYRQHRHALVNANRKEGVAGYCNYFPRLRSAIARSDSKCARCRESLASPCDSVDWNWRSASSYAAALSPCFSARVR